MSIVLYYLCGQVLAMKEKKDQMMVLTSIKDKY